MSIHILAATGNHLIRWHCNTIFFNNSIEKSLLLIWGPYQKRLIERHSLRLPKGLIVSSI
jgi:hypothetical protein